MVYLILILYFSFTFLTSLIGSKNDKSSPESYFLANRNLKTLSLFFTILATNFSAFYFLGFAGEGYRIGYPYYVVMALGTSFACLSFFLIGNKTWILGRKNGYITASELILGQTSSRPLSIMVVLVMIFFTFPYLALQLIGAGYILESITDGQIPYFWGCLLLALFTIVYVFIGGMRSVASTDLKQGLLAILLMLAAVIVISSDLGGWFAANEEVMEISPELFSRYGKGQFYNNPKWFSLLIMWIFCIPMFPQIFMRFFIAKELKDLKNAAFLYALIPLIISIFPVIIGVLGHLDFPQLSGKEADQILPMMLMQHSPKWFSALVLTGAIAAFMSTLDSQLLALSTMATRDIIVPLSKKKIDLRSQVKIGRVFVVLFAIIGLGIAMNPFDTIFDIGKLAFSGLAVLFPPVFAALHFKLKTWNLAILLVLASELCLALFYYQIIPDKVLGGFEPIIPIVFLSLLILYVQHLFHTQKK